MLARWRQYASLPLRLVLGALFLMHRSQKLFGVFGGPGLSGTAASMASLSDWESVSCRRERGSRR